MNVPDCTDPLRALNDIGRCDKQALRLGNIISLFINACLPGQARETNTDPYVSPQEQTTIR
jgi:hypothetical protein